MSSTGESYGCSDCACEWISEYDWETGEVYWMLSAWCSIGYDCTGCNYCPEPSFPPEYSGQITYTQCSP